MTDTTSPETVSLVDTLTAIREEHGALTPVLLVEVAADPTHALHDRFEWDDRIAGHKYRVDQARHLLMRVVFRPDPAKPNTLRYFMATRGEDSPTSEYVPTGEALADPFTRELLLRQMKRDAATFAARYKHLAEYAAVVANLIKEAS